MTWCWSAPRSRRREGAAIVSTLFVSDVHLSAARPDAVAAFLRFLDTEARTADALYVLGDLFDLWLGDDDARPPHGQVVDALAALTASGVNLHVAMGNHDFLLGDAFRERTGCTLVAESTVVDLYGTPVLLMHGDQLCTDDTEYQDFRSYVRNPAVQQEFLALDLPARVERARSIRELARQLSQRKPEDIMDVNVDAVAAAMTEAGVAHLVHGHTHRPGLHEFSLDGAPARRLVLGDWYEGESVLRWGPEGFDLGGL